MANAIISFLTTLARVFFGGLTAAITVTTVANTEIALRITSIQNSCKRFWWMTFIVRSELAALVSGMRRYIPVQGSSTPFLQIPSWVWLILIVGMCLLIDSPSTMLLSSAALYTRKNVHSGVSNGVEVTVTIKDVLLTEKSLGDDNMAMNVIADGNDKGQSILVETVRYGLDIKVFAFLSDAGVVFPTTSMALIDSVKVKGSARINGLLGQFDRDQAFDEIGLTDYGMEWAEKVAEAAFWSGARRSEKVDYTEFTVGLTVPAGFVGVKNVPVKVWDKETREHNVVSMIVSVLRIGAADPRAKLTQVRPLARSLGVSTVTLSKEIGKVRDNDSREAITMAAFEYLYNEQNLLVVGVKDRKWFMANATEAKGILGMLGAYDVKADGSPSKYSIMATRASLVRTGVVLGRTGGMAISHKLPMYTLPSLEVEGKTAGLDGAVLIDSTLPFDVGQVFMVERSATGYVLAKGMARKPMATVVNGELVIEAEGYEPKSQMGRTFTPGASVEIFPLTWAKDSTGAENMQLMLFSAADVAGAIERAGDFVRDHSVADLFGARQQAFADAGVAMRHLVDGRLVNAMMAKWSTSGRYGSKVLLVGQSVDGRDLMTKGQVLLPQHIAMREEMAVGDVVIGDRNPGQADGRSKFTASYGGPIMFVGIDGELTEAKHGVAYSHNSEFWLAADGDGDGDDSTVQLRKKSIVGGLFRQTAAEDKKSAEMLAKALNADAKEMMPVLCEFGPQAGNVSLARTAAATMTGRGEQIGIVIHSLTEMAYKGHLDLVRVIGGVMGRIVVRAKKHPLNEAIVVGFEKTFGKITKQFSEIRSYGDVVAIKDAANDDTEAAFEAAAKFIAENPPMSAVEVAIARLFDEVQTVRKGLGLVGRNTDKLLSDDMRNAARRIVKQIEGGEWDIARANNYGDKFNAMWREVAIACGESQDEEPFRTDATVLDLMDKIEALELTLIAEVNRGVIHPLAVIAAKIAAKVVIKAVSPEDIAQLGFSSKTMSVRFVRRPRLGVFATTSVAKAVFSENAAKLTAMNSEFVEIVTTTKVGKFFVAEVRVTTAPEVVVGTGVCF